MPNYAAIAASALRSIRSAGGTMAMTRTVGGTWDPVAGTLTGGTVTTWDVQGIVLPVTANAMSGMDNALFGVDNIVLSKARIVLIAASGCLLEPQANDRIAFDGKTWVVSACSPLKPAGVALIYKMGVKQL